MRSWPQWAGIVGYFDLIPGAHDIMTRYDRATGFFKDPNVLGPFLVPALVYTLHRLTEARLRKSLPRLAVLLVLGFAMLLSFSRGAWFNLGVAVVIYGALYVLTVRSHRARLRFMTLGIVGMAAIAGLVVFALQLDGVKNLAAERASLSQRYDEGPRGASAVSRKRRGSPSTIRWASAPSNSCRSTITRSRTTFM